MDKKKKVGYSTTPWKYRTVSRYVSLLAVFQFINYQINIIMKTSGQIAMTGRKFSKTKVVHKQREKRKISKNFFRKNDLKVVIKWNLKFVNYLDVTLNLLNNTFNSFSKSNNEFNYLHKESNHPPCQTSTFFNRATLIKAFLF